MPDNSTFRKILQNLNSLDIEGVQVQDAFIEFMWSLVGRCTGLTSLGLCFSGASEDDKSNAVFEEQLGLF